MRILQILRGNSERNTQTKEPTHSLCYKLSFYCCKH